MKTAWNRALLAALTVTAAGALAVGSAVADAVKKDAAPDETATAEVGKPAPDFTLTDTAGHEHALAKYLAEGKVVVLEWFNPDCPFVQKVHKNHKTMSETEALYAGKNVVWLAVNSGAPGKQGAGRERNLKAIEDYGITYPVLLDESGTVGKMYGAKTTPQIFVIDPEGTLLYNGPLDDVPTPTEVGKVNYVKDVLDPLLAGKPVEPKQIKSYGCSVKYAS